MVLCEAKQAFCILVLVCEARCLWHDVVRSMHHA